MAVGRDGRPEAETFLWEKSAKMPDRPRDSGRHGPFRPRPGGVVVVPPAVGCAVLRQPDVCRRPPAAGSAAAVVTERRRASPAKAGAPMSARSNPGPRVTGPPSGSERSAMEPRVPARPPGHPSRPPSRGTRLSVAPKVPAVPARCSERTASPRVRAMAALADAARAQAAASPEPAALTELAHEEGEQPLDVTMPRAHVVGGQPSACALSEHAAPARTHEVGEQLPAYEVGEQLPAWAAGEHTEQSTVPEEARPPPVSLEEAPAIQEFLERIRTVTEEASPAKDKAASGKPVAGPPTLDDRPVATPTKCKRPFQFNVSGTSPIRNAEGSPDFNVADTSPFRNAELNVGGALPIGDSELRNAEVMEMWLRLARIALLELTKLPPPSSVVGHPFARLPYNVTEHEPDDSPGPCEPHPQALDEESLQALAQPGPQDLNELHLQGQRGDYCPGDGARRYQEHLQGAEAREQPEPQGYCPGDGARRYQEHLQGSEALEQTEPQGSDDTNRDDRNPWMSIAFPEQPDLDADDQGLVDTTSDAADRAMQAWTRILFRVMSVVVGPGPPPEQEEPPEGYSELPPEAYADGPPSQGCAHICLGELMEESVSWFDADSEDDHCSPKEADRIAALEEEAAAAEPVELPRGMKDVYRQQNAPGIVAGMQKCLSF